MIPDGKSHPGPNTVESDNLAPPPRGNASKKRHKTPSQYGRDKRRLAEYKRSKRQKANSCDVQPDDTSRITPAPGPTIIRAPAPAHVDISHLLPPPLPLPTNPILSDLSELDPLHTSSQPTLAPAPVDITTLLPPPLPVLLPTNQTLSDLSELDPFHMSTQGTSACVKPSQRSKDSCLELPTANLEPGIDFVTPPAPPSTETIMEKVAVAASAIADVNHLVPDPSVTRDVLRSALAKANDGYNEAKQALKDSELSGSATIEALKSLNAAFEKAARTVISKLDTPLDGSSENATPSSLI